MDYETLFIVLVSVFLIQAIALVQTWRQNPDEIGIRDWAVAAIVISFGSLFSVIAIELEGPHASSATFKMSVLMRSIGAAAGASGWIYVWLGLRHFYQQPALSYHYALVFPIFFTLLVLVPPTSVSLVDWRVFWVSLAIALFAAMTLYEFLRQKLLPNPIVLAIVAMLGFTFVVWFLRMLSHTGLIEGQDIYSSLSLYNGIIAGVSLTVSMILLTNERINMKLVEQATRDPLTGTLNRRAFIESSSPYLASLQRSKSQLAVCVLDLDHFKSINDRFGHGFGDQVLQEFVEIARIGLREGDLLARYGGEEFVILLPNTSGAQACHVMQRLNETLANNNIVANGEHLHVTFSAGVCCAQGPIHIELENLLEAADRAMYKAKAAGRNRVESCPDYGEAKTPGVVIL